MIYKFSICWSKNIHCYVRGWPFFVEEGWVGLVEFVGRAHGISSRVMELLQWHL